MKRVKMVAQMFLIPVVLMIILFFRGATVAERYGSFAKAAYCLVAAIVFLGFVTIVAYALREFGVVPNSMILQ